MKVIITESKLKEAIFKYFDNQKSKGIQPSVNRRLANLFKSDEDTLLDYLFDYNGGREGATKLAKQMLKNISERTKINDVQFEGDIYFSIDEVGLGLDDDGYLPISVSCYGNLVDVEIWNDDIDDTEVIDTTLYRFYESLDMSESWDVADILKSDINSQMYDMITSYTGVLINVEILSVIEEE